MFGGRIIEAGGIAIVPFLLASAKKKRAHPAPIPSPISDDWSSEE